MNNDMRPMTLVIFGASGDLAARKLVPSLYRMARKKRLPEQLQIVGVARSEFSDDAFREKMAAAVREFAAADWDERQWQAFAPRLHYAAGDAAQPGGLKALQSWLAKTEGDAG